MDDPTEASKDRLRAPKEPGPSNARRPSPLARYWGTRLMLWGRGLAVLGLIVFGLVAAKAYIAYSRHELGTALATAIAGGTLAIALVSVGESLGKRGGAYLRGEKPLVRSIGRAIGRSRSRRSRP